MASPPRPEWTGAGGSWARGNYACNAGGLHTDNSTGAISGVGYASTEGGASPPCNNSPTNLGVPTGTRAGGVMCINWGAGIHRIEDGASNTIMLAEVRNGAFLNAADSRGVWALGMPGASVITGDGWDCTVPNSKEDNADDCEGCINDPQKGMGAWPGCPFQQATARSRHTGVVLVWFSWHAVFLLAVPVMVLLLVLAPLLLPEYRDPNPGRLDPLSAAMSMGAVLCVIYGMKHIAEQGPSWLAFGAIAVGVVLTLLFLRRQRRQAVAAMAPLVHQHRDGGGQRQGGEQRVMRGVFEQARHGLIRGISRDSREFTGRAL